ncbi:hypothetical protein ACJJTC_003568, partial [Scirpophaga incertulas]
MTVLIIMIFMMIDLLLSILAQCLFYYTHCLLPCNLPISLAGFYNLKHYFIFRLKLIFAVLYPDKLNRFKDYWKLFMKNLIELKKEEIQSEENKKNEFMSLCSLDTEDQKLLMELTLLINIVPPKGRVYKTGKFCTQECLDSNTSMIIVENSGDINTHHTEANRKLMFNLTLFFLEPCKKSAKHILSLTIL